MFDSLGEILRVLIFSAAHIFAGSLGSGVILVSAGIRLALLPLTLRIARNARDQQLKLAALKPQLEALQRQHAKDPVRFFRESQALQKRHGIRLMTPSGMINLGVQIPLIGGLFAAVRSGFGARVPFLWIADLARPDATLVLGVTALTAAAYGATPVVPGQPDMSRVFLIAAVVGTGAFLWTASSAVALSIGAGSLVTGLQNALLARDAKRIQV